MATMTPEAGMPEADVPEADVFVVGAGPTGLVLALWLVRQGATVRIVDKAAGPGTASRAMAVQARTLEFYGQIGLADRVVAAGLANPALNLWAAGRHRAKVDFGSAGARLTPFPFVLVYPQDRHERMLIEALREAGVEVERETEVLDFVERTDRVEIRTRRADGKEATRRARYLAGADGASSTVRHALGLGFEGGTYPQVFYVADIEASGPRPLGEIHLSLAESDFALLMSYDRAGSARLIGAVRGERADAATLAFDDIRDQAIAALGIRIEAVRWFSTYKVHHRVADRYRRGRAFLLGDAAHVHSPAGGQGMNTGIGDAVNLAWKLAAVVKGEAADSLLDSYEIERRAFAETLVATTDRLFAAATAQGRLGFAMRRHLVPVLVPFAYRFGRVREELFGIVSQTRIAYRDSPLSRGSAGRVHGGDRLPWVTAGASDDFEPLRSMRWQVHVHGAAPPELARWCARRGIALVAFPWSAASAGAGFERGAAYLVRPDMHVALADPEARASSLDEYLDARGLSPA